MSISYRADIDGLRALAVSLVIFNHLGITLFSGGYIGVDVFFVISGYLITSILIKDSQNQRFDFGAFYKKRVIRLAPAFFTVLLTVSAVSCILMLPHELMQYFKSVIYSTFFMANVYMRKEVGDYFSSSTDQIPLLHLWSLGVEEQFYIFWPLCLLFLLKKVPAKWMLMTVTAIILLFMINAELAILKNVAKAYYKMPVRAFELLIGAAICFMPKIQLKPAIASMMVWAGLTAIVIIAVCFDEKTVFPGLMAVLPCTAAALIIYAGQFTSRANPVLSHHVSVWLGKISYPMYLWHWPFIAFFNLYLLQLNPANQAIIFSSTILLAYATYRFIELPCRKFLRLPSKRVIVLGFALPAIAFTGAAQAFKKMEGLPQRFPETVLEHAQDLITYAHDLRGACHNTPSPETLPEMKSCSLGIAKSAPDFMLIGDSHANHFTGMIDVWAKDSGLNGYDATQDTTVFLPDTDLLIPYKKGYEVDEKFRTRNDVLRKHLETHHYQKIILAGYYEDYFRTYRLRNVKDSESEQVMMDGMRKAIPLLLASADEVILLLDTPTLTDGIQANCPVHAEALQREQTCTFGLIHDEASEKFSRLVYRLQKEYPKLKVIDPKKVLCEGNICNAAIEKTPLYRDQDDDHLNYRGSEAIGRAYMSKYGNPLL